MGNIHWKLINPSPSIAMNLLMVHLANSWPIRGQWAGFRVCSAVLVFIMGGHCTGQLTMAWTMNDTWRIMRLAASCQNTAGRWYLKGFVLLPLADSLLCRKHDGNCAPVAMTSHPLLLGHPTCQVTWTYPAKFRKLKFILPSLSSAIFFFLSSFLSLDFYIPLEIVWFFVSARLIIEFKIDIYPQSCWQLSG